MLTNTTNSYGGGTYVEGGTLMAGTAGNAAPVIPANSNVTVFSGGTFEVGFTFGPVGAAPLATLTLDGGTFRVPALSGEYDLNRLMTTAAGGTVDLSGSTARVAFNGAGAGATINGNTTLLSDNATSRFATNISGPADLTIAPNITLTSHIPLAQRYQIVGGGTLYMVTAANSYIEIFTVTQGRLRVDDLSVTNGQSVLGGPASP